MAQRSKEPKGFDRLRMPVRESKADSVSFVREMTKTRITLSAFFTLCGCAGASTPTTGSTSESGTFEFPSDTPMSVVFRHISGEEDCVFLWGPAVVDSSRETVRLRSDGHELQGYHSCTGDEPPIPASGVALVWRGGAFEGAHMSDPHTTVSLREMDWDHQTLGSYVWVSAPGDATIGQVLGDLDRVTEVFGAAVLGPN